MKLSADCEPEQRKLKDRAAGFQKEPDKPQTGHKDLLQLCRQD